MTVFNATITTTINTQKNTIFNFVCVVWMEEVH